MVGAHGALPICQGQCGSYAGAQAMSTRNNSINPYSNLSANSYASSAENTTVLPPPAKRKKASQAQSLDDYPSRFKGLKGEHMRVKSNVRGVNGKIKRQAKACVYCSLQLQKSRKQQICKNNKIQNQQHDDKANWDKEVKRTEFFCSYCKVYLCSKHFLPFHEDEA